MAYPEAKKINWPALIICLLLPLAVGWLSSLLAGDIRSQYQSFQQPALSPPGWVFPVAWGILYLLMGISSYLVYTSDATGKKAALLVYGAQLLVNALWTPIFFGLHWYLVAFDWLLLLLVLVITMTILFYRLNKTAGLLQLPYILWLLFAGYLNLGVYLLNR